MNINETPFIIELLQELESSSISIDECFELICHTLKERLNDFDAVSNIHNYAQICFDYLYVIDVYYGNLLNNNLRNINHERKIRFTNDMEPKEMDHGVVRACDVLCMMIEREGYDEKVTASAVILQEYIKSLNLYSTDDFYE